MDLQELRLRASPWIALGLGAVWITAELVSKRGAVAWDDVYPGICLITASMVLFATIKWLNRPFGYRSQDAATEEAVDAEGE